MYTNMYLFWGSLLKYKFFVLFFCSLLQRLAVRISLPFHICLQADGYANQARTIGNQARAIDFLNHVRFF